MAIEAAKMCNLKEEKIFKKLHEIKDIDGRLELVKVFPNNIKVFIDFAHTPDALLKVIKSLKKSYKENISLVFGWVVTVILKRPLMGKIASSIVKKFMLQMIIQKRKT